MHYRHLKETRGGLGGESAYAADDDDAGNQQGLSLFEMEFEEEESEEKEKEKEMEKDEKKKDSKHVNKIEKAYFSVVMGRLVNVLRDNSLAVHHQAASSIAIRIIKIVGPKAYPQINGFMSALFDRLYEFDANNNFRLSP